MYHNIYFTLKCIYKNVTQSELFFGYENVTQSVRLFVYKKRNANCLTISTQGNPTALTSSGKCYNNFGPSCHTNNDT